MWNDVKHRYKCVYDEIVQNKYQYFLEYFVILITHYSKPYMFWYKNVHTVV